MPGTAGDARADVCCHGHPVVPPITGGCGRFTARKELQCRISLLTCSQALVVRLQDRTGWLAFFCLGLGAAALVMHQFEEVLGKRIAGGSTPVREVVAPAHVHVQLCVDATLC
jgi:hypothetical protein